MVGGARSITLYDACTPSSALYCLLDVPESSITTTILHVQSLASKTLYLTVGGTPLGKGSQTLSEHTITEGRRGFRECDRLLA